MFIANKHDKHIGPTSRGLIWEDILNTQIVPIPPSPPPPTISSFVYYISIIFVIMSGAYL